MFSSEVFNRPARRVVFVVDRSAGRTTRQADRSVPLPLRRGQMCACGIIAPRGVGNFLRCRTEWVHDAAQALIINPGQEGEFIDALRSEFGITLDRTDRNLRELELGCGDEVLVARPRKRDRNGRSGESMAGSYRFEVFRVGCPACLSDAQQRPQQPDMGEVLRRLLGKKPPRPAGRVRVTIEMPAEVLLALFAGLFGSGTPPASDGPFSI